MLWETILKKRQFQSIYFKELREALLKIVKGMESGNRFRMEDLTNDLVEILRKERTPENKNYNSGLTQFANYKADKWLKSTGSRILNNAGLVTDVHTSTIKLKVVI